MDQVCQIANVLIKYEIQKGDPIIIYMPMIPEAIISMLACAHIGAVHAVVFAGFSAESLHERIQDCGTRFVITANEGKRGGRTIPMKLIVDNALALPDSGSLSKDTRLHNSIRHPQLSVCSLDWVMTGLKNATYLQFVCLDLSVSLLTPKHGSGITTRWEVVNALL
jgi:acyl-coenzyme A synthetase/AMP-(fatty) acid ligase